jgi:hypothetical protein
MEAASVIGWKPLGELLVERGLLTVDQLDAALEEQKHTGERLGAILVSHRVIASAVLTTLLAEQVGVELEKQSGFGSGLFAKIARRNGGDAPVADAPLALVEPSFAVFEEPAPAVLPAAAPVDQAFELMELRVELEIARSRVTQLEAELDELRATMPRTVRKPAATRPAAKKPAARPAAKKPAAKKPAAKKPAAKKPAARKAPAAKQSSAKKVRTTG